MTTDFPGTRSRIDWIIAAIGAAGWLIAAGGIVAGATAYVTFVHPRVIELIGDASAANRATVARSVSDVLITAGLPLITLIAAAMAVGGLACIILSMRARRQP